VKKNKQKSRYKKIVIIVGVFIIFLILDVIIFIKPFQDYIKSEGGFRTYSWKTDFVDDCKKSRLGNTAKCTCIADDLVRKYGKSYELYDKKSNDLYDISIKWEIRSNHRDRPTVEMQESILACEQR